MSDLQVDLVAAAIFIGLPVYHLVTCVPYSNGDDSFYEHLAGHSAAFPRGWLKLLFPFMWMVLWPAYGVAQYLFWHSYTLSGSDTVWLVGMIFSLVALMAMFAWYNMFFRRRAVKSAFFISLIPAWGGVLAFLVCACIYPQTYTIVVTALMLAWLTYATVLTGIAAFVIPAHHRKHPDEQREVDEENAARAMDAHEPHQQMWPMGTNVVPANATIAPTATATAAAATFKAGTNVQQRVGNTVVSSSSLLLPGTRGK
jgi:tryptophan-rich sensory protein